MTPRSPTRRASTPSRKSRFSLNGADEVSPRAERILTGLAWALAAALAIALIVMVVGPHKVGDYFTETDFYGAYAKGAKMIQQGRLIPSRYGVIGPGYEVALGLAGFVVRDLFLAARLMSIVATVGTLLLWFYLLKRRAGARVAFFAAVFMATNAYFFRHGYGAMTDAPAIALQAVALFFLLTRSSDRAIAGAGLVSALAFLTRYNAIVLLPTGLVAILGGGTSVASRRRAALLFTAGFFAPVVPWILYSLAHGGGFSLQLHHNIAYDVFARARGISWDDYQKDLQPQFKTLWDVIARDPGAVTRRLLFNVGDHLRKDASNLLGWPIAVAALLGVVAGLRDGTLKRLWPLGVLGALLFGTLLPVFYSERYSLALLPLYATLAGTAFGSPFAALALGRTRKIWLKPALAVFPIIVALTATWRVQARVFDQLPVEVLQCAETLKALRAPGDRVIARKWHIAYHGGVEPLAFPFADSLADLAKYAHANRARWLYFSWPEAETRPQFFYLLDTSAVVPGLTVRRAAQPHPAVLYEIGPEFGTTPKWFANDTLRAWHTTYARLMVEGNNPELLYKLGGIAWTMGRLKESRGLLEMVIRLQPRNLDAHLLLGSVLIMMHDAPRARVIYRRAESLAPGNVDARLGLGWASLVEGDYPRAGELWRPLISATQSPGTVARMAALYRLLQDPEAEAEAISALSRLRGSP